jgi:hypothetical protein
MQRTACPTLEIRSRTLRAKYRPIENVVWCQLSVWKNQIEYFICFWRDSPQWTRASSFTRFLDHTQRSTTVVRTPLDKWSARRRDLYLTTYTTLTTDKRPCPGGIRTNILRRRVAADLRLRPRGNLDRANRTLPEANFLLSWAWTGVFNERFCVS